jgi:brefeldin A-inhibited guanine nucleotide-exchange protein
VLHEYADQMHFTGMSFDEAIRHYLSGFRLPGEAQKIDRMMEKFAERYCLQNPSVFPSADTAFILAFSVIMLNTDLHNPAIREDRRMTKAGFIGNNRGIAAGGNLDEAFLSEIFDRIKAEPISLKEDDVWRAKLKVAGGAGESALSPFYATFTGESFVCYYYHGDC